MKLIKNLVMSVVASVALTVVLTGCGTATPTTTSSETTTPTPTPTNPNIEACHDFETASNQLGQLLYGGKGSLTLTQYQAAMSDAANAMDKAGLTATGAVQQRINDLITIMPPNPRDMMLSTGKSVGQKYNTSLDRVSNACDAENATIELTPVTLSPF